MIKNVFGHALVAGSYRSCIIGSYKTEPYLTIDLTKEQLSTFIEDSSLNSEPILKCM